MILKICSKCKTEKSLSDFHKHSYSKNGYRSKCKVCRSKPRRKIIVDGNKKCPKCKILKSLSEYYTDKNSPHGISTRCKKCIKKHVSDWKKNNPEKAKKTRNRYYKNNQDKIKEYMSKYQRDRKKNDIEFKILGILRSRIYSVLRAKKQNRHKYHKTSVLIGISIKEFIKHLENLFTSGMTLDNHGEWHIDHIKPCASFDLTDPEQQKECFHFTNLQPLWAEDNLKKGCKLITHE